MKRGRDYTVINAGSIIVLTPISDSCERWCRIFLPGDVMRWGHGSYIIEPRYIQPILEALADEGTMN